MNDFVFKQILIAHPVLWEAMQRWAADHQFNLDRIPDTDDEGNLCFRPEDDPDHTPTYAFMPKLPGDQ